MAGFTLTSPSFGEGEPIDGRYSCDGTDLSPALEWEGAPEGTGAFALIVDDPDARDFVHWVIFDLPGGTGGSLAQGVDPSVPAQGRNDFGRVGYGGPCPPSGTHHYRFTLYALSRPLRFPGHPSAELIKSGTEPILLGRTTLTGTYTRQR